MCVKVENHGGVLGNIRHLGGGGGYYDLKEQSKVVLATLLIFNTFSHSGSCMEEKDIVSPIAYCNRGVDCQKKTTVHKH